MTDVTALCVPCGTGQASIEWTLEMFRFVRTWPGHIAPMGVTRAPIDAARNTLVYQALNAKNMNATHVVFIDDDTIPCKGAAQRLFELGQTYDVAGLLAFRRTPPFTPCAFMQAHDDLYRTIDDVHDGVKAVDAIGMACSIVKRGVFEAFYALQGFEKDRPKWFRFTQFGEDIQFCRDAKSMGYSVVVDTDFVCDHLGEPIRVNAQTWAAEKEKLRAAK